jgi:hypothetical protein
MSRSAQRTAPALRSLRSRRLVADFRDRPDVGARPEYSVCVSRAARDLVSSGLYRRDDLPWLTSGGRFAAVTGGYFPILARETDPDHLAATLTDEATHANG